MELKTLALLAAVLLAATQFDTVSNNEWSEFKLNQGKAYSSETEEAFRQAIFNANVAKINAHNADETQTYKMGINQFTDLTQQEFETTYLMAPEYWTHEEIIEEPFVPVGDVNWVTAGAVQRVKDQGRCGSCWAFGAVAAVESAKFIDTGVLGAFSEQQLTSCDTSNGGCNGGLRDKALNYMANAGICTESSYPYTSGTTGSSGTCTISSTCTKDSYTIQGSSPIINTYSALTAKLDQEPICTGVDASNWSSYSSGIFSNCGSSINHGVLSAGYTGDYLLIKNSWGSGWGESGYIRLKSGNTCGSGARNYYPLR